MEHGPTDGSMPPSTKWLIFLEGDIFDPMQAIFNVPMGLNLSHIGLCTKTAIGEITVDLMKRLLSSHPFSLYPNQLSNACCGSSLREGVRDWIDPDGSLNLATMGGIILSHNIRRNRLFIERLRERIKLQLICFEANQVRRLRPFK